MLLKRESVRLPDGHRVDIDCYCPDVVAEIDAEIRRPAVVICGGGAYRYVSPRETEPVALDFAAQGYNAFVVWYRVAPDRFPKPQWDAAAAVAFVRRHAEELHTHPGHIALLGFSAGGHCAASVGTLWNEPEVWEGSGLAPQYIRPDALVLCYPVITAGEAAHREAFVNLTGTEDLAVQAQYSLENRVSADTPPTFLWHTWTDESVPVENALLFASALSRCRVPAEVHLFPRGKHGSSLCREETSGHQTWLNLPECAEWPAYARRFLEGLWNE